MIQLLYVSVSNLSGSAEAVEAEVTRILSTAYLNNRKRGLTGILFHCEQYFAQLIEGAEHEVQAAFEAIKSDGRHHDVTVIFKRPIDAPMAPATAMGCAGIAGTCPDMLIPTLLQKQRADAHEGAAKTLVEQMLKRARAGEIELPPVAQSAV
jgi:hypothetical protein